MIAKPSPIEIDAESGSERSPRFGYHAALDGMRAVCVLSVIIFHSPLGFSIPNTQMYFLVGGFLGVDGFFVLSGFLITTLLVEEWEFKKKISLRRFYLRRALRLLPALGVVLAAGAVYAAVWARDDEVGAILRGVFASLAYCSNFLAAAGKNLHMFVHTWSLSTEEHFYLIWPLALYAMLRAGWRRSAIVAVVALGICASAGWRAWLWTAGAPIPRFFYAPDMRADALLMGCLFALLRSWKMLPSTPMWRLAFRCLAVVAALYLGYRLMTAQVSMPQIYQWEMTTIALAFAVVILNLVDRPLKPLAWALENPVMVWLGRVSYGLYLWHPLIIYFGRAHGPHAGIEGSANHLAQAVSLLAIVAASFYFVERPCLRLKRKFEIH